MSIYTVTGGTGYIGSKLLEHLSQNEDNHIYAIVRLTSKVKVKADNIEYVIYDETEKSLENPIKNSDYIIHLGALYTTANDEDSLKDLINSNILFSTLIFNVANRVNKNVVIAAASTFSSLNGLGELNPATLYAATKSSVETIAHFYKDLSIHFLTFPDTYGPGDWRAKVHNLVIKNEKWPFEFRGNSEQQIMLLHVDDVIGHLLASLENKDKGVHIHDIYSRGSLLTLKELSEQLTDNECVFNDDADIVDIPLLPRKESKLTGYVERYSRNCIGKVLKGEM